MGGASKVSTGGRSPAYPYIDLETAIKRVKETYQYAKRSEANIIGLYKHWGFSGKTGSSKKNLAALKYYGLLDQVYGSQNVKLSDRGFRIAVDHEGSEARAQAIVDAFLSPNIYAYCWELWGDDLPHDDAMRSHLLFEKGFNDSTVGDFIDSYKRSMEFSNIAGSTKDDEDAHPQVEIGDLVQWESQGQLRFPVPCKVIGFTDDRSHLYVEGSQTGVPVDEVEVVDPPGDDGRKLPPPLNPLSNPAVPDGKVRQDTFSLDEGQVLIQFPAEMSAESFDDLTDWLILQHRKIGRAVDSDNKPKLSRDDDD